MFAAGSATSDGPIQSGHVMPGVRPRSAAGVQLGSGGCIVEEQFERSSVLANLIGPMTEEESHRIADPALGPLGRLG